MLKKLLIPLVLLLILALILGAVVTFGAIGAVLPWFVVRSEPSMSTKDTPVAVQPVPATLAPAAISVLPPTPVLTEESADPTSCTTSITLTPASDQRIEYKGISFILDPTLAMSVTVQECPTVPYSIDLIPGKAHPAYIAFIFPTERKRIDFQPELRVYTVVGDMQSFLYPLNSLDDLRNVASKQLEPITWFDGAPLHVQRSYLPFAKGYGVRGVVEYAQDIFFYTNNGLLYEYNGLTDDSRFYVNMDFPLAVPFLMDIENSDPRTNINPQAIVIPEWTDDYATNGKIIAAYNQEALSQLEAMKASDFAPSLEALDTLIGSLEIK